MYNFIYDNLIEYDFMTKTFEDLKKIINEQEAALLKKARQQIIEDEDEKKKLLELQQKLAEYELNKNDLIEEMLNQLSKPTKFEMKSANEDDWEKITQDFKTKFGEENIQNGGFRFPSRSEAEVFFQDQATKRRAFFGQRAGHDDYVFSDGDGHFIMGGKVDIIRFCKEKNLESPFEPEESFELDNSFSPKP
jgi:hypothetical protein